MSRWLEEREKRDAEVKKWEDHREKASQRKGHYVCARCHKYRFSKRDYTVCPSCQSETKKVPKPEVYLFQCFKCRQVKRDRVKGIMVCRSCSEAQGLPAYDVSATTETPWAVKISSSLDGLTGAAIYAIVSLGWVMYMSF